MANGKWQRWVEADQLERITNWSANGCTDAEIAKNMGVCPSTYYEWLKRHAEISEAVKAGRLMACEVIENALFKRAVGMTLTDTVEEFEGQIVDGKPTEGSVKRRTTTRQVPPDTGALVFYLKNRMADRYSDRRTVDVGSVAPRVVLGVKPGRADG